MTVTSDSRRLLDSAVGLAADNADQADRTGRLSEEVVDAVAAITPQHFVPARWGGAESSFRELTDVLSQIGEGCTSAAWCAAMFAYSARFAAHLPVDGQRDLWGESPNTRVVPGLVPAGTAEQADGGFLVRGRWRYVSGVEFADWALIAGPAPGGIEPRFFAVPRADFTIERTWDAVGMRATGSHSLVLSRAFVPERRSVSFKEVMAGVNHAATAVQHAVPLPAVGGLTCLAPVFGAARGALAAAVATTAGKYDGAASATGNAPRTGGPAPSGDPAELAIAAAAARIEAASLLIDRVVDVLDAGEGPGRSFENANRATCAAVFLVEAVNALMRAAGTAAQDRGSPLQRFWRDVTIGCSHAALRPERSAPGFVRSLAGRHDRI
jgi:alkylation response protein AidB-like acyl-CoA dehydrogenase